MIDDRRVLAIVPARGGSRGVPRKNVRPLCGRPLLAWTIEAARGSRLVDRLIVSSEDPEIIEVARALGCEVPFVRPADIARDETPGIAPVRHAIAELPGFDYAVLLQPTSPLRVAADIDACIARCREARADACVTVTAAVKPPQWTFVRRADGVIEPLLDAARIESRRQDYPSLVMPNGAVYVARALWLAQGHTFFEGRVVCHEMPPERSLDIDTEWDWYLAERVLSGPPFAPPPGKAE
ncbi:MAG: acylneuraminate cytidylyltransferase family protein [Burkholderiales bacterium]|nr:acylneuraminate cytidylyltransferase family protein [Burkholderiales bacterium]